MRQSAHRETIVSQTIEGALAMKAAGKSVDDAIEASQMFIMTCLRKENFCLADAIPECQAILRQVGARMRVKFSQK